MVGDGVVDEHGVAGLAGRLAVSPRHLHRVLVAQLGASPAQLAQTRRAQVARMLIEQTAWPMADVAFAAGFRSVRQFNAVMRAHVGAPPSSLRTGRALAAEPAERSALTVQLRHRPPLAREAWISHVAARAVPGLEAVDGPAVRRVVRARGGPVLAEVHLADGADGAVTAHLTLTSLDDLSRVVGRLRHWLDLDADPARVDGVLGADPLLAPLVARRPGLRVPGTVDAAELALRAVLGQQISVAAARTITARLVAALGEPTPWGLRQFPTPGQVREAGVDVLRGIGLTGARAATVVGVAALLDSGLAGVRGVGPWTVEYIALRGLADPDAFPADDLVLRRALGGVSARDAVRRAEAWRPWRGYAAQHLWTAAGSAVPDLAVPNLAVPNLEET